VIKKLNEIIPVVMNLFRLPDLPTGEKVMDSSLTLLLT
jgi:hypothetical protein